MDLSGQWSGRTGSWFANVEIVNSVTLFGGVNKTPPYGDKSTDNVGENDIKQGGVGDCEFAAALAALAKANPAFIHRLVTDNGDGTCTVNLWAPSPGSDIWTPKAVTVDMTLDQGFSQLQLVGDTDANGALEIWPQMVEKGASHPAWNACQVCEHRGHLGRPVLSLPYRFRRGQAKLADCPSILILQELIAFRETQMIDGIPAFRPSLPRQARRFRAARPRPHWAQTPRLRAARPRLH